MAYPGRPQELEAYTSRANVKTAKVRIDQHLWGALRLIDTLRNSYRDVAPKEYQFTNVMFELLRLTLETWESGRDTL